MKNYKRYIPATLGIAIILMVVGISGCVVVEKTQQMYFEGDIIVVLEADSLRGSMSHITFEVYTTGIYEIEFSTTDCSYDTPEDFIFNVTTIPRKYVLEQDYFPDDLVIKISFEGKEESQKFTW